MKKRIIALLLVLQVALLVMVYLQFAEKLPILLNIQWVFAFAMIVSVMDVFA